jgi:hypothetical protein
MEIPPLNAERFAISSPGKALAGRRDEHLLKNTNGRDDQREKGASSALYPGCGVSQNPCQGTRGKTLAAGLRRELSQIER